MAWTLPAGVPQPRPVLLSKLILCLCFPRSSSFSVHPRKKQFRSPLLGLPVTSAPTHKPSTAQISVPSNSAFALPYLSPNTPPQIVVTRKESRIRIRSPIPLTRTYPITRRLFARRMWEEGEFHRKLFLICICETLCKRCCRWFSWGSSLMGLYCSDPAKLHA